jgi:hypothetical protein
VAVTGRVKKDLVAKEVFESYLWLMRQGEVKLHHTSSLDLALAVFLLNVGEHVNDKIYEQFLLFARIARGCFHEHGEEVHKAYFSRAGAGPFQLAQFSLLEVKYFPIICDFAVQCYIPATFGEGGREVNASLMELMLFDFCNWLYQRRLTPIRTSFAREFKLDYKPPPAKARHGKPDPKEPYPSPHLATTTRTRRRTPTRTPASWKNWTRTARATPRPARNACLDLFCRGYYDHLGGDLFLLANSEKT